MRAPSFLSSLESAYSSVKLVIVSILIARPSQSVGAAGVMSSKTGSAGPGRWPGDSLPFPTVYTLLVRGGVFGLMEVLFFSSCWYREYEACIHRRRAPIFFRHYSLHFPYTYSRKSSRGEYLETKTQGTKLLQKSHTGPAHFNFVSQVNSQTPSAMP